MIIALSKGRQITIPAEFRNEFDLQTGSKLEIIKKGKEILLRPVGNELEDIFSKAKKVKPKHHLTAKQMDELNEAL